MRLITAAEPGLGHYVTLGVSPTVTTEQLRTQWLSVCAAHHPDVCGGIQTTLWDELRAAYAVLSDPGQRSFYDLTGVDPNGGRKCLHMGALNILRILMEQFVEKADPERVNVLAMVRTAILSRMPEVDSEIANTKARHDQTMKRLKSFQTMWSGAEVAKTMTEELYRERIAKDHTKLVALAEERGAARLALSMLEGARYDIAIVPVPATWPDRSGWVHA